MIHWSILHAIIIFLSTLISFASQKLWIVSAAGSLSFLFLIFLNWGRWSKTGPFGIANLVTLARLGVIILIGIVPNLVSAPAITISGFLLLTADGIDGWIAKRLGEASEFGEYFDKETDAFFLLLVCLLALSKGLFGPWILALGLLRYGFVLLRWFVRPGISQERKSNQARFIYTLVMGALLLCFLPISAIQLPLAALATMMLVYSFAGDLRQIVSGE